VQEGLRALDDIIAGAPDSFLAYAWRGVSKSLVGDLEGAWRTSRWPTTPRGGAPTSCASGERAGCARQVGWTAGVLAALGR